VPPVIAALDGSTYAERTGESNENVAESDATMPPIETVMSLVCAIEFRGGIKHPTDVTDVQDDVEHSVIPVLAETVNDAVPKFVPYTVSVLPADGTVLIGTEYDATGESNEKEETPEPTMSSSVIDIDAPTPVLVWQETDVAAFQLDVLHTSRANFTVREGFESAKFIPCIVIELDVAVLGRFIEPVEYESTGAL
jgi:hypothetical protein